jgi:hypothetical protein
MWCALSRQERKIKSLANHCFDIRVKRPTKQTVHILTQIMYNDFDMVDGRCDYSGRVSFGSHRTGRRTHSKCHLQYTNIR